MNILLTNDDGIRAEGLKVLYEKLKDFCEISIVAPEGEQSGVGHGITLSDPLRVRKENRKTVSRLFDEYSISKADME